MFYQSVWFLNKDQYGSARLTREVVEKWLSGKLEFGGQKINLVPSELTQEEIASVPGGAAAQNNLDSVQWEVSEWGKNGDQGGRKQVLVGPGRGDY